MVPQIASCLVGLITIEELPRGSEFDGLRRETSDATLAGILIDLVHGRPLAPERSTSETAAPWLPSTRFASLDRPAWGQSTRLSADLECLAAQLELTLVQARQRIIAAANAAV
jgi:hypothetical protein